MEKMKTLVCQAALQSALLLRSYDPAEVIVLKVYVADRDAAWSF